MTLTRRRACGGRAALALVGLALALAVGLGLLLLDGQDRPAEGRPTPQPVPHAVESPAASAASRVEAHPESPASRVTAESALDVSAVIARVQLALGPDVLVPAAWSLSVRRPGGELVAEHSHTGAERDLEIALAPGLYALYAAAPGLASRPLGLEVQRGSSPSPTLVLEHLCTLIGSVVDEDGAGVAGLRVYWHAVGDEASAPTDALGSFRLAGLFGGTGELALGDRKSPLVEPRTLEVRPGSQTLEPWSVPRLGSLEIQVIDEDGQPVPAAELDGSGDHGGAVHAVSDQDGRARAAFLPRGMYRVFATHPALGRGNTIFEFTPGDPARIEIRLRRTAPATGR